MRGVNRIVHTRSIIRLCARMQTYQRPPSHYWWVPDVWATPRVACVHSAASHCPPQAAPGTRRVPRAAAPAHPEMVPASGASGVAAQPPCALRAAANTPGARHPCWPTHRGHPQRRRSCATACRSRDGPIGHRSSRLGSTWRRPRGSLAAAWSPAGCDKRARMRQQRYGRLAGAACGRSRSKLLKVSR